MTASMIQPKIEGMKILFLCVANSARSQMAEALAKKYFGDSAWIESAGSRPTKVSPHAVKALKEVGISLKGSSSKSVQDLPAEFLRDLGFVITLCSDEVCPHIPEVEKAEHLHWPLPDPAAVPEKERPHAFRDIRDVLEEKLRTFRWNIQ